MTSRQELPDPIEQLWLSQPDETMELDMDRIRSSALQLERTVARRNRREVVVAWILFAVFVAMSAAKLSAGQLVAGSGTALVAVSMLWIVFVLRRFGGVPELEVELELRLDGRSFLASYRGALARQRRLLSLAWLWYCLPIFVGLMLASYGSAAAGGEGLRDWALTPSPLVTVTLFVAIAVLNGFAGRRLQARLDELAGDEAR